MSETSVRLAHELPSRRAILATKPLVFPLLFATAPMAIGLENVPSSGKGPLLFVGNHTVYGLLDTWALFLTLLEEKNIFLRGLGDHLHFKVPVWGEFMQRLGAVDGTRENCAALMEAGESLLVFPGGAREVSKRKGEKYRLIWKERIGFARMAIAHGATIVPFAAVGIEDAFDLVLDADDLFASPLGPVLRKFGVREDALLPLGVGPRPERLYFKFGSPIPTAHLRGRENDDEVCRLLRDRVRTEVELGIEELRTIQAEDTDRRLPDRVRAKAKRALGKARSKLATSTIAPSKLVPSKLADSKLVRAARKRVRG